MMTSDIAPAISSLVSFGGLKQGLLRQKARFRPQRSSQVQHVQRAPLQHAAVFAISARDRTVWAASDRTMGHGSPVCTRVRSSSFVFHVRKFLNHQDLHLLIGLGCIQDLEACLGAPVALAEALCHDSFLATSSLGLCSPGGLRFDLILT